jgi:hypothetical protein
MSARFAEQGGNVLKAVLRFLATFTLNSLRRLIILGRYTLICWQQQRLRRAWRRLGQRVYTVLEEGEVNPMLTEPVKDAVKQARSLKAVKDRHYQAILALREKMRAARAPDVSAPAEEAAAPGSETGKGSS